MVDIRASHERVRGRIDGVRERGDADDPLELCLQLAAASPEGIVMCATGVRSEAVTRELVRAGHLGWCSLAGGIVAWSSAGLPVLRDAGLTDEQHERYSRQLLLPDVGVAGQLQLLRSRVLVVGAGGLGSPVILYLAAAGVGTIGIADDDRVEASNLHRQVVHDARSLGESKAASAARRARDLNPDIDAVSITTRVDDSNVYELLDATWDVIVDCSDSFATRYLLSDAAVARSIPVVHGSIYRTDGQVAVLAPPHGPCYRCLYPVQASPALAPSCADAGVLGVLPGIIGSMQANEAIKLLLGVHSELQGGLLLYDAIAPRLDVVRIPRRPGCPGCDTPG
jgi:molybdopterin/thiamine biosynthesis adenylyltransferase/rhodanese-related sulfurtransferase